MGRRRAILQVHHTSPLFWGGIENQRWVYDAAARRDIDVLVLTDAPPSWLYELVPAERVTVCDLYDYPGLLDAARHCATRHAIAGVVTYAEEFVVQCAAIAAALRLPGIGQDAARRSSMDKVAMRECLVGASVTSPRFLLARTADELRDASESLGCPTVVKPRCGGGSVGVLRMESASQAAEIYAAVAAMARPSVDPIFRSFDGTFLVEEYIPGRVLSVDGIVFAGQVTVAGMTDTLMSAEPRFYQEGCWTIDILPECRALAIEAVNALGFETGCFHCEVRLGPRGPAVLEVAARLPGELIVPMYKAACGVDLLEAALDLALGLKPLDFSASLRLVSGSYAWFPQKAGRLQGYSGIEEVLTHPRVERLLLNDTTGIGVDEFNPYAVVQLIAPSLDVFLSALVDIRSRLTLRIA